MSLNNLKKRKREHPERCIRYLNTSGERLVPKETVNTVVTRQLKLQGCFFPFHLSGRRESCQGKRNPLLRELPLNLISLHMRLEDYSVRKTYKQPPLRLMGGAKSWRKCSGNNCNNHFHLNRRYTHCASNIIQIKRHLLRALIYPQKQDLVLQRPGLTSTGHQ